MTFLSGAALLGCLLACAPALAQPIIRTETRLVLIDVSVRDKKSKPAAGLSAADFRIWDDGKEQPIVSLSPGEPEREYLLFLFDNSTPQAKTVRRDVSDFAGAYASPDRFMAVLNFNGETSIAQNFTALAERVQRAAADVSQIGVRSTGSRAPIMNPNGGMDASNGRPNSYYNNTMITPEMGVMTRSVQNAQQLQTTPILQSIRDLANSMASIRGRKSIVVLGGSDPMIDPGPNTATQAAARDCNKANVAIYATSMALKSLSQETGGRWLPGDLVHDLGGLVGDQQSRYVLAFRPVESPDGSCHSLRVRTSRAGLDLTARDAYCNVKPPDLLAGKVEGKALESRAPGAAPASIELPYFYSSPGIALVDLVMEMDLANLKFAKQNGKQHADLNLVGLAYGADGEVAARFSDTVPLDSPVSQPYRYERQFRLPAGRYNVRVIFGSAQETIGKAETPLTIDPWDGAHPVLSGIALAADAQEVPDLTSDLDPSLLEGHKDLIANSLQLSPSGSNRFHASAPCYAYLEIYNPSPALALRLRLLDRATAAPRSSSSVSVRANNAVTPAIFQVPIASLPPGAYTLEVTAPGTTPRTVDFQVVE